MSRPVRPVPDARLVELAGLGTKVPPGTWTTVGPSTWHGISNDGRVWIHPHDLLVAQVVPSHHGCCGYAPSGGADNLHCRCGAPLGIFVDECSCAIEVALDPVWVDEVDLAFPDGITRRLGRFARAPAPASEQLREATSWGCDEPKSTTPNDVGLQIVDGPGGPRVELVADERRIGLAAPWMLWARAIALVQLPVGDERLVVQSQTLDERNGVIETWAMVRRDDHVAIVRERAGHEDALIVPSEWLDLAWKEAVARWEAE